MPQERKLAAIMFTDIVGYTASMGDDESKAFELLKRNRQIQKPIIKRHSGKWLKEMGDGVLASFPTVTDAVHCAAEIQHTCESEPNLKLRIGINLGEVVFEKDDVFGDGVNIASRLESLAPTGGIYISESVFRNIQNKIGIQAEYVREETLKNVKHPVKIYEVKVDKVIYQNKSAEEGKARSKVPYYITAGILLVVIVAFLIWFKFPFKSLTFDKKEIEKSIAVLPFKNLSKDLENQYFADGIMEGILNHLSKIKDLRVASRSSTEKYRESIPQAQQIVKELDVSYYIEASVFKSEDRIRVSAQLIDARKDENLWSEQYDRELSDLFGVMSEIAIEVASEVKVMITPEVKERMEVIPTENIEAYELYLKGRGYQEMYKPWYSETESQLGSAIHLYKQAIDIDPEFALAYIWLGVAYHHQIIRSDYFKETFADTLIFFANKALSLNPDLEEGYWLRGNYYYEKGEFQKSIDQIERAIELNPNYGNAYLALSMNYSAKSDYINTLINVEKAKVLKIGSIDYPYILMHIGSSYNDMSYYDKAEIAYSELVNHDPIEGYQWLWRLALTNGNWTKMKFYGDKICAIDSSQNCFEYLISWYKYSGDYIEALKYYEKSNRMELERGQFLLSTYIYAYLLFKLDKKEKAKVFFNKQI